MLHGGAFVMDIDPSCLGTRIDSEVVHYSVPYLLVSAQLAVYSPTEF